MIYFVKNDSEAAKAARARSGMIVLERRQRLIWAHA
jgi:hypothetical protein